MQLPETARLVRVRPSNRLWERGHAVLGGAVALGRPTSEHGNAKRLNKPTRRLNKPARSTQEHRLSKPRCPAV
jgi:hypothetical protein